MILNSISFRNFTNIRDVESKCFDFNSKSSKLGVTIIAIGLLLTFSIPTEIGVLTADYEAYAQSEQGLKQSEDVSSSNPVTIKLDSVKFSPLDDSGNNQLKVEITYQTNDPSFVNTIMAGVMKVYTVDGTLIKTSSIPSGYVLGQTGPMQFATSFDDQTLQDVKAEIAMTDTSHTEKISNTLEVVTTLTK
jgi:hypothetical protein